MRCLYCGDSGPIDPDCPAFIAGHHGEDGIVNDSPKTHASITKLKSVSTGVTISRLKSGHFAISAHRDDMRVIVEITKAELKLFVVDLTVLAYPAADIANAEEARRLQEQANG